MVSEVFIVRWDRERETPVFCKEGSNSVAFDVTDGGTCLWTTGFISNRRSLARQEGKRDSISDRELTLYLHQKYGQFAAQHIAGPFAWVLWDSNRRMLIGARDRVGICGLYYFVTGKTVLLANRVDILLDSLPFSPRMNSRSVVAHLCGETPLEGETFYENVCEVVPGGYVQINRGCVESKQYWRIEPQPELKCSSDAEYAEVFRSRWFQIIAEYVPPERVGVTLSGGMDSTTIAAGMREASPNADVIAFSHIAPELSEADESHSISAVAQCLGMPVVYTRADEHWSLSSPEGIRTLRDAPFYNIYYDTWEVIYQTMRQQGIEIAFTGSGGDQLFGADVVAYPDLFLTGHWIQLARQMRVHLPYSGLSLLQFIRLRIASPIKQAYFPMLRKHQPPVEWLGTAHRRLYRALSDQPERFSWNLPGKQQRLRILRDRQISHFAQHMNLQASRFAIHLRHPFLDHRLMEFAASLPTSQTCYAGIQKVIMRNAMLGILPDAIVDRTYKTLPLAVAERGLREREQPKVWKLLTNMRAAELGFVDEKCLQKTYRAFLSGNDNVGWLWLHALSLEDWLRRYF